MRKLITIALAGLLPLAGLAEKAKADDCLYNQEAFKDMLEQLRSQYSNSKYTENKEALVIFLEHGAVTVSYGGCEHYSTEINYVARTNKAISTMGAFTKATELVKKFGQDRVDPKALRKLLSRKKYKELQSGMFIVPYPDMDEFTIEIGQKRVHATIVISFYN
jgi:hypothetical protein